MEKNIYDLELHESIRVNQITILRVPSGWIYFYNESLGGYNQYGGVFVPFDSRFSGMYFK